MPSLFTTFLTLAATCTATVIPRSTSTQWQINNFTVESFNGSPVYYSLNIAGEGESAVVCQNSNTGVASTTCPDAQAPEPFNMTACDNVDTQYFYFKFGETNSPLQGQPPAFFVQFEYLVPGSDPIYGCSGLFSSNDTKCINEGEILQVPAAFNVTTMSSDECIYA